MQSALMRPKWEERRGSQTYGQRTIAAALSGRTEYYAKAPGRPSRRLPVVKEQGEEDSPDEANIPALAAAILMEDHFAQDGGGSIYVYRKGVYAPGGERRIQQRVKALLETWGLSEKWTSHRAKEVIEYIRVDAPALWASPPRDTLNVLNGLLDISTGQLLPHTPEHLSSVQLPVSFDPAAICPMWEQYIVPCFPDDAPVAPFEVAALVMLPDTSIQKAVLALGEGSNGKSTWLTALTAFLGRQNVSGLSLHKLEENRFAMARLIGKLANICPDLPSAHLAETSTFKALTGTEAQLTGEVKYKDSFEFAPFARLVFSANQPPRSNDATHAFFRRWIVYPFTKTFEAGTDREPVSREWLDAQLAAPQELSGVLNRALAVLPRIRAHGLTESPCMKAAWNEFRQETDPLAVWLDQATVEDPDGMVVRKALRMAYSAHCTQKGIVPLSDRNFGSSFKRLRPHVQETQRTVAGKVEWVYVGIRMGGANPDGDGSQHSQVPQDSSNCFVSREAGETVSPTDTIDNNSEKPVKPVNAVKGLMLTATPAQVQCARVIAAGRQKGKETRKPEGDLGSPERNLEADFWGSLAELVLADAMERAGLKPEYVLLDKYPVRRPDFLLNGRRYEAKTCPPGRPFLCINQKQYNDPSRQCDFYLPVLFRDEDTLLVCAPIPHQEVSRWEVARGHSPYYRICREHMQPLTSLEELQPEEASEPSCVVEGCPYPARYPFAPDTPRYCVHHGEEWRQQERSQL